MDKSLYKDVYVFVEQREGVIQNVAFELLGKARELADILNEKVCAILLGNKIADKAQECVFYGADTVCCVDAPELEAYLTEPYTQAICRIVKENNPSILLIGATTIGRDLGPRISARLETGLTADCTGLDISENRDLMMTRPAFGGNLMATILCPNHRPQIGTCRPGVFKKLEEDTARTAEIVKDDFVFPAENITVKLLEMIHEEGEKVDLEGAEIIVSGGRGVGGPEGFAPVRALAQALGGVTGSSRAAVDAGWIPHSHQVGQTGKTVGPKLYVACGISGAIQHLAGMSSSENIVCINKDVDAPIFGVADFGVVGNLFDVLPVLTDLVNKSKG